MTIRPAYPDELNRARPLLGSAKPSSASRWLVAVKERPVERLLAALAWWEASGEEASGPCVEFAWGGRGVLPPEALGPLLEELEAAAREHGAGRLQTGLTVAEDNPLHALFLARGFKPCRTFRDFMMPGDAAIARVRRIHPRLEKRIPDRWKIERLHAQDPAAVLALLGRHALMTEAEFTKRWHSCGQAGFDDRYSVVVTDGGKLIGLYLLSHEPGDVLRVHAEVAAPAHEGLTAVMSCYLRYVSLCRYPDGFPRFFSSTAAGRNAQARNTALRLGGTESPPRYVLEKRLGPRPAAAET